MSSLSSVSVGIVTWNAEHFIDATLAGVASQDLLPESVIVLDNGSTDFTVERIDRWKNFLPIDLVSLNQNLGICGGKRTVLERVSTDYIAFLDHDDYWFPNYLSSALAQAGPTTIVSPSAFVWAEAGGRITRYTAEEVLKRAPRKPITRFPQMLLDNQVFAGCVAPAARLRDCGAFLGNDLYCCDYDAWARFVIGGGTVRHLKHPTVLYRNRSGSASNSTERLVSDELLMIELLRDEYPTAASAAEWETAISLRKAHLSVISGENSPAGAWISLLRNAGVAGTPQMTWRAVREVRRQRTL